MTETYAIRSLESEHDHTVLFDLIMTTFNTPRERSEIYFQRAGPENFRLLCRGDRPVGCVAQFPMGQFFGGRSVPMVGIAVVAVTPEHRGRGAGGAMMAQTIQELAQRRVALSTLYPATLSIYRRAGYETAGHHYEITLPLCSIDVLPSDLTLRPVEESDHDRVEDAYRTEAARSNGPLDRSDFLWMRVRQPPAGRGEEYLVERDGRIEGAFTFAKVDAETIGYNLAASDIFALTPDAARAVLRFLALHQSMAESITMFRPPNDPLLAHLKERGSTARILDMWMTRVVDVEQALTARGYHPGIEAEIHLDIRDELIPANNDRFILRVADGRGRVERGGTGALTLDIRGLAALYTGYRSPANLAAAGLLNNSADQSALAAAESIFTPTDPWMADRF